MSTKAQRLVCPAATGFQVTQYGGLRFVRPGEHIWPFERMTSDRRDTGWLDTRSSIANLSSTAPTLSPVLPSGDPGRTGSLSYHLAGSA